MGLDMSLTRTKVLNKKATLEQLVTVRGVLDGWCNSTDPFVLKLVKQYKETGAPLMEEVVTWRRVIELHYWFLHELEGNEHGDDCYEVKKHNLEHLISYCEKEMTDYPLAGSQNREAIKEAKKLLKTIDFDNEILVYSFSH